MNHDEKRYRPLIKNLPDALTYYQVVKDDLGFPVDFIFLEVNDAFAEMTGLDRSYLIGRKISELEPKVMGEKFDWVGTFGQVAQDGEEVEFEIYSELRGCWYNVSAFTGETDCIAIVFRDITTSKQAEEDLRQNEAKLKEVQVIVNLGLWEMNLLTKKLTFSEEVYKMFAISEGNSADTHALYMTHIHPEDRILVEQAFADHLKSRKVYELEHRLLMPDGDTRWVRLTGRTEFDQSGEAKRTIGTVQDITERLQVIEALQRSWAIVENIQIGLHIYHLENQDDDRSLRLIYANPVTEKLTGVKAKDVQGKTIDENFPGLRKLNIPQRYAEVVRTGVMREFEDVEYSDDRVLESAFSVKAFPLPNSYVGVAFDDVTKRRKAEEALSDSLLKLQEVLSNIPESGVVFQFLNRADGAYEIPFMSDSAEMVFEKSIKELQNPEMLFEDFHPDDLPDMWRSIEESARKMEPWHYEFRILTERAGEKWIRGFSNPRWFEDGSICWTGMLTDITDLKNTEEQLEKAREQAEEANRAKSRFLATMSHEIRTPMNVIIGMTGLLCESDLEKQQKEYACMARDSADHLLAIIDDILDFSRIEAEQLEILPTRFELDIELKKIIAVYKEYAQSKGLDLLTTYSDDLPKEVYFDQNRLKQVLINLISNAIKFTEKGRVELTVSLIGGKSGHKEVPVKTREICFAVSDTGPGISPEDQGKLFKSFSQSEQGIYRGREGTGLGLAISKSLVELMGGKIWLESSPEHGSTFYFTLPLTMPDESEVTEPSLEKNAWVEQSNKELSLLIAEDKVMNQKLIRVFLEEMGHQVEIVSNGREAVEAVDANNYDAVFMDINMPEMDGLEAARTIRDYERKAGLNRAVLIAMTAYAMKGDREMFIEAGFNDYISKPISRDAIKEVLQKV